MQSEIVKRGDSINYRVYKFRTENEMRKKLPEIEKTAKTFNYGFADAYVIKFVDSHASPETSRKLNLKLGEPFSLVSEPAQQDDEKTNTNMNIKNAGMWTPEELAQLWDGTKEEVASKLGRPVGGVGWQRRQFVLRNPNFVVPPEADYDPLKGPGKSFKKRKPNANKHWTAEDEALLWTMPIKALAKQLGRTEQAVRVKRHDYLKRHPKFTPPKDAFPKRKQKRQSPARAIAPKPMPAGAPLISNVRDVPGMSFKFKYEGQEIELPSRPKTLRLGDLSIEF